MTHQLSHDTAPLERALTEGRQVIVGVDPGLTTGVVALAQGKSKDRPMELLYANEFKGTAVETMDYFQEVIAGAHRVVYETFISISHEYHVDANPPVQLIGILLWQVGFMDGKEIVGYTPSSRNAIDEKALIGTDYQIRGGGGHARQALRHVLAEASRNGDIATLQIVYPRE